MGLPDFIILGETKCGTTSLYNYLIEHPKVKENFGNKDVVPEAQHKEMRFFDKFFDRGIGWYQSLFPETKEGELTGESTPMYLYRTITIQRILKYTPNVKFIVLLRNPVNRLYSNYYHFYKYIPQWSKEYPDFETYLNRCNDRDYYLIDKGLYYYTLIKWFDYFPREQFFIETTENLNAMPQKVYSSLLKFLNLSDFKIQKYEHHRINSYPKISDNTAKYLNDFYSPYNEKLKALLNIDLNW
ncbi:MAG: sulfotransferase domain-containing protein [Bacteroidales bacterium]|nr:sulfotransferase domain-containing protein [Bacteroidales bacterium]